MDTSNLITVKQYADSLGVSPSYIYKQYREFTKGERISISFEIVKIGGIYFVKQ